MVKREHLTEGVPGAMKRSLLARVRRAMTPRRWVRKPLLFGAVVALVVGLGAGTAFAFFTGVGNGSGAASVGTVQSVTVDNIAFGTATVTTKLYPGATNGDLKLKLDNPNSYPVTIVSIAAGTGTVAGSGGVGTCSTTGVSVNAQTGLSISVPSGTGVFVVIPNAVSMDATSDSGCQGATFQVPVTITVEK
jgi:hypothetical protein